MMRSAEKVKSDYDSLLQYAQRAYYRGKVPLLFSCVEALAHWLYHTGLKFYAPELDKLIRNASFKLGLDVCESRGDHPKVVFIDYFAWDNKGLTEQYLSALVGMGSDLLYINLNERQDFKKGRISKFLDASGCNVVSLSKHDSAETKIVSAYQAVSSFLPSRIFFHVAPWDVVSPVLCCFFPNMIKLNINITDHAFWLGVTTFDYVLNFRRYGSDISIRKRGMRADQQLLAPMYPVTPDAKLSILPFKKKPGETILITGGAFYKVIDEDCRYLNLIASVLDENPHAFLYFIGSGDSSYLKRFIGRNKLEDRFFLIDERKDFLEVLKASDIYIGTYPVGGGLMTQYCALAGLPFVALKGVEDTADKLLSVLSSNPVYRTLFESTEECLAEINRLIFDKEYRRLRAIDFHSCAPSKEVFESTIKKVLDGPLVPVPYVADGEVLVGGTLPIKLASKQELIKYNLIPLKYLKLNLIVFKPEMFFRSLYSLVLRLIG